MGKSVCHWRSPLVCDPHLSRSREVAYCVTSVLWGSRCGREDRVRTILPSDWDGAPAPCLGPWSLRPTVSLPTLLGRSWRAAFPVTWGPSPPPTPPSRPALSLPSSLTSAPSHCSRSEGGAGRSAPWRLPRELLESNPFQWTSTRPEGKCPEGGQGAWGSPGGWPVAWA